jgi:hypothetical protein
MPATTPKRFADRVADPVRRRRKGAPLQFVGHAGVIAQPADRTTHVADRFGKQVSSVSGVEPGQFVDVLGDHIGPSVQEATAFCRIEL